MSWYINVLTKKYAVLSGRARRKEYWYFVLFNLIIGMVLSLIDGFLGKTTEYGYSILSSFYYLLVLIPSIAVSVRRLHDIGRSGWWLLIGIIPILGTLALLVFMVTDSQQGENEFGPNPKDYESPLIIA